MQPSHTCSASPYAFWNSITYRKVALLLSSALIPLWGKIYLLSQVFLLICSEVFFDNVTFPYVRQRRETCKHQEKFYHKTIMFHIMIKEKKKKKSICDSRWEIMNTLIKSFHEKERKERKRKEKKEIEKSGREDEMNLFSSGNWFMNRKSSELSLKAPQTRMEEWDRFWKPRSNLLLSIFYFFFHFFEAALHLAQKVSIIDTLSN